ncbi:hypothetical protein B0T11DRAFT_143276 [Plectosphaerella cucumerina]|uniref:Uncharacterized protein n=1 Tax=Plectosphaerella cucumerina TaxID=40658 RepID=A0A8K0T4W8_9PEZI|nr:hypothetical protein B0T11DRAFT_143276 [Plectosphaerella cucumerina]
MPAAAPRTSTTSTRSASRPFATSAKVHPNILPFLQTRRSAARWLPPIVGVAAAAYAANTYRESAALRREAEMERQAHERRRMQTELMEAYGDGESLDALERAVAVYESQKRG